MLIDTMFARDMYQVYEINDDWLRRSTDLHQNHIEEEVFIEILFSLQ